MTLQRKDSATTATSLDTGRANAQRKENLRVEEEEAKVEMTSPKGSSPGGPPHQLLEILKPSLPMERTSCGVLPARGGQQLIPQQLTLEEGKQVMAPMLVLQSTMFPWFMILLFGQLKQLWLQV